MYVVTLTEPGTDLKLLNNETVENRDTIEHILKMNCDVPIGSRALFLKKLKEAGHLIVDYPRLGQPKGRLTVTEVSM